MGRAVARPFFMFWLIRDPRWLDFIVRHIASFCRIIISIIDKRAVLPQAIGE